jgi:hypothetical protein
LPVPLQQTTDVQHLYHDEIVDIDGFGAYWRRKA